VHLWQAGCFPVEKLVRTFRFHEIATTLAAVDAGEVVKAVPTAAPDEPGDPA